MFNHFVTKCCRTCFTEWKETLNVCTSLLYLTVNMHQITIPSNKRMSIQKLGLFAEFLNFWKHLEYLRYFKEIKIEETVTDIDECARDEWNDCDDNAQCTNNVGLYSCRCNDGFLDISPDTNRPGRLCASKTSYHWVIVLIPFHYLGKYKLMKFLFCNFCKSAIVAHIMLIR